MSTPSTCSSPALISAPCRAHNMLAGCCIVDPTTGHDLFLLSDMNEFTGMELLVIDLSENSGRSIAAPAGSGSWAFLPVPDNRLVIGTYYDGSFLVFDLRTMQFTGVADFPGETYIWNLAMGKDGRVYGGSYGNGKLGALDLQTLIVEDCGAPAPPNLYLRTVSALPDGRILCSFTAEHPVTLVYDLDTGAFDPVPDHLSHVQVGVSWHGYFLAGSQAFTADSLQPVSLPFPVPDNVTVAWSLLPQVTTDQFLFLQQGETIYRYTAGEDSLLRMADVDLRGGRILASDRHGRLLGIRGQEYFIIHPGDRQLHVKPVPVAGKPRPTLFLRLDSTGRIWGGPHFGQTLFYLDPETGDVVNTPTVCDSGGEVYDVVSDGSTIYAVSYCGGDIIRYSPDVTWNQLGGENPRVLAHLASQGYIRPTGGILFGNDGLLYSGWTAEYGRYGGAVAITDPQTGHTILIENPLGEQGIAGIALDEQILYLGTSIHGNGLPPQQAPAVFGVLDLQSHEMHFRQEFAGAEYVRLHGIDRATGYLVVWVDGEILLFDRTVMRFNPGVSMPTSTCYTQALPGDGTLVYSHDRELYLGDLRAGTARCIAESPAFVHNVIAGRDREIYFAAEASIYRLRLLDSA